MSDVIPFPTPPVPEPKPPRHTGKQIWLMKAQLRGEHGQDHELMLLDAKIHAVCNQIRRLTNLERPEDRQQGRCLRCPRFEVDKAQRQIQRMCYGLAEEMVALAICGDLYEPE